MKDALLWWLLGFATVAGALWAAALWPWFREWQRDLEEREADLERRTSMKNVGHL